MAEDEGMKMTEYEATKMFNAALNDMYGTVNVAGLEYETDQVLQAIDETAYRTYFNDWLDGEDIELED